VMMMMTMISINILNKLITFTRYREHLPGKSQPARAVWTVADRALLLSPSVCLVEHLDDMTEYHTLDMHYSQISVCNT